MSKFTEKELIELGFKKEYSFDTTDGEPDFYYFTFDFKSAETLITNCNDDKDKYKVYMFNVDTPKTLSKVFVEMYIKEFKDE